MKLASIIDHTHLKASCTTQQILQLCEEAKQYGFASVCVPPNFVSDATKALKQSAVKVCTVIGFPNGYQSTKTKLFETKDAIKNGAEEIDMVIAIGKLKEENINYVKTEINQIFEICKQNNRILKVIIETALLNEEEKKQIIKACGEIGVDFVKTSTGFSHKGATKKDVTLMREILPEKVKIKAAGGIKTKQFALELVQAGADRLGCSSGISIVNES